MFSSISWNYFLIVCLILVVAYYVVLLFFSLKKAPHKNSYKGTDKSLDFQESNEGDAEYTSASDLKLSIQEVFSLAINRQWIKEELLSGLAARLQIYSHLQDTPYQHAIESFIIREATEQLRIPLTREDVSPLW